MSEELMMQRTERLIAEKRLRELDAHTRTVLLKQQRLDKILARQKETEAAIQKQRRAVAEMQDKHSDDQVNEFTSLNICIAHEFTNIYLTYMLIIA